MPAPVIKVKEKDLTKDDWMSLFSGKKIEEEKVEEVKEDKVPTTSEAPPVKEV